jgi:hypothetical protein
MKCNGLKDDGSPCASTLGIENGFCAFHDPERAEFARAARAKGGTRAGENRRARRAEREAEERGKPKVPRKPRTLDEAVKFSAWAMHAAAKHEIDCDLNRSIQYGVSVFKSALEKRDLEARCRQLEKKIQQLMKEKQA